MASASVLPRPPVSGLTLVQLSFLQWLEQEENERAAKYAMFRDYYEGEHQTQLTARMRKFLELKANQEFNLNFCPIVVDALAEKLKVARFECEGQTDVFTVWCKANRLDALQAVVHLAAIRDGDTYVLVEWDNDASLPRFTHESAYDGAHGMHVVYSDERRTEPMVAIKRWTVTSGAEVKTRRVNLYYPDRIEKYTDAGTGHDWLPYEEDDQPWPIPWPFGIPVIHFRNKDQGYSYGESELEDVIPVQNGLNKTFIDLLSAADTTGFRNFWMTGDDPSDIKTAPGSWFYSTRPEAKIGALDPADISGLIALKDSVAADIAKMTRTPLSFFQLTGQVAAQGTLKEQRAGLIAKARDRQAVFGNAWEDVLVLARRLHNAYGTGRLDESQPVDTVWQDDEKPEPRELAEVVELLNRAAAASTKTKVQLLHPDWDDAKVEEEVQAIRDEQGMSVPDIGPLPGEEVADGRQAEQADAEGQASQAEPAQGEQA